MKRVVLSLLGTVVALVALLSFKSHDAPPGPPGALPVASASGGVNGAGQTSSAPPNPSGETLPSVNPAGQKTTVGRLVETRYGRVQVKVVTTGKAITAVSFVQLTAFDGHSAQINSDAAPILLQQTIKAQSAHIDGVSGATYTTDGYRTSLQYALDQVGIH